MTTRVETVLRRERITFAIICLTMEQGWLNDRRSDFHGARQSREISKFPSQFRDFDLINYIINVGVL